MKLDELNLAAMLRTRSSAGDGMATSQDNASPLAWRREMEKAQADAWFHDALRTTRSERDDADARDGHAPRHACAGAPRDAAGDRSPAAGSMASDAPHDAHQPAAPGEVRPTTPLQPVPWAVAALAPQPAAFRAEPAPIAQARPMPLTQALAARMPADPAVDTEGVPPGHPPNLPKGTARPVDGSRLPVRVHVEGDAQHATVWLGVDAAARTQVPAVAEAIGRWLAQAGYGVPTFVCNGRVMPDQSAHRSQERAHTTPSLPIEPATGESP